MWTTPDRSVIAAMTACGSDRWPISLARIRNVPLRVVIKHASAADGVPESRWMASTPA
jgi:hypothetical protein